MKIYKYIIYNFDQIIWTWIFISRISNPFYNSFFFTTLSSSFWFVPVLPSIFHILWIIEFLSQEFPFVRTCARYFKLKPLSTFISITNSSSVSEIELTRRGTKYFFPPFHPRRRRMYTLRWNNSSRVRKKENVAEEKRRGEDEKGGDRRSQAGGGKLAS